MCLRFEGTRNEYRISFSKKSIMGTWTEYSQSERIKIVVSKIIDKVQKYAFEISLFIKY